MPNRERKKLGVKLTAGQREMWKELAIRLHITTPAGRPLLAPMVRHVVRARAKEEGIDVRRFDFGELLGEKGFESALNDEERASEGAKSDGG